MKIGWINPKRIANSEFVPKAMLKSFIGRNPKATIGGVWPVLGFYGKKNFLSFFVHVF